MLGNNKRSSRGHSALEISHFHLASFRKGFQPQLHDSDMWQPEVKLQPQAVNLAEDLNPCVSVLH